MGIVAVAMSLTAAASACSSSPQPAADLLLVNARVYTLAWPDPDAEGRPSPTAPHDASGWRPDADTVAIAGDRIVFAGRRADAPALARGGRTIDLNGATVIPGLIDAHVHMMAAVITLQ